MKKIALNMHKYVEISRNIHENMQKIAVNIGINIHENSQEYV